MPPTRTAVRSGTTGSSLSQVGFRIGASISSGPDSNQVSQVASAPGLFESMTNFCPAWKRWGTVKTLKPNAVILPSRKDDVIPFSESEELLINSRLPSETLIEVGSDDRLADDASLSVLLWACCVLTSGQMLPAENEVASSVHSQRTGEAASQKEGMYVCDACGEEIIIPLDLSEGASQVYVEDCPVCCRANTIHVDVDQDGNASGPNRNKTINNRQRCAIPGLLLEVA